MIGFSKVLRLLCGKVSYSIILCRHLERRDNLVFRAFAPRVHAMPVWGSCTLVVSGLQHPESPQRSSIICKCLISSPLNILSLPHQFNALYTCGINQMPFEDICGLFLKIVQSAGTGEVQLPKPHSPHTATKPFSSLSPSRWTSHSSTKERILAA